MSQPRTPREAKQEFLDDIVAMGRNIRINPDATVQEVLDLNRKVIREVADNHGLIVPPQ